MKNNITHIKTLLPPHCYSEHELVDMYTEWIKNQDDKDLTQRAISIFQNCGIKKKHTIIPIEEVFSVRSLDESNGLYKQKSVEYACKIAKNTLENASIKAEEIDFLITTSCTGIMSPSINSHLINELSMRNDVLHIPIAQIGCIGGINSIIYIDKLLKSKPKSKGMIINLEFSSNTMQYRDFSMDNIVSTALFADGVACTIVQNGNHNTSQKPSLEIINSATHQFKNTEDILRYDLGTSGFKMKLSRKLPSIISASFLIVVEKFLTANGLSVNDIDHFLVHPGGIRILELVEEILVPFGKNLVLSKKVLENHGNMSSTTIMFIIKELLQSSIKDKEMVLIVAFGPGFSLSQVLIQYNV